MVPVFSVEWDMKKKEGVMVVMLSFLVPPTVPY